MSTSTKKPTKLINQSFGAVGAAGTAFSFVAPMQGVLNGRLRGNVHSAQDGTLLIEWGSSPTTFDLAFDVSRDATQADFQFPFDVIVYQPFLRVSFVNGGAASAFVRASIQALPV